ncbi:hypothetical protein EXW41_28625 (plasmid) [Bacillus wiedmannii]|nr:hypothetical protein CT694_31725 [Bacillus wiedmannii bv. thuringiensis]QWH69674.1 hypothetical protein EXW41_28625 [Bacillus wiedmannii]
MKKVIQVLGITLELVAIFRFSFTSSNKIQNMRKYFNTKRATLSQMASFISYIFFAVPFQIQVH